MGKKILVVDDSHSILKLVRHVLEVNNFEVETADNGAQALDKYSKFRPDVVTLDISMPIMDGYETLSRLLKLDPNAVIIMLTAMENEEDILKCLQKGARAYLVKPIRNQELLDAINQVSSPDYDKHISLFFSQINDRLDRSIKKILGPLASVALKDVRIIREQGPGTASQPQCKSMWSLVEPPLKKQSGKIGYVTEFSGEAPGMVVSFIDEKNLCALVDAQIAKGEQDLINESKRAEFFNMMNMKMLSELSNYTNLRPATTTRQFDEDKDGNQPVSVISKADFEMTAGDKNIDLEVQLWLDIEQIFGNKIRSMQL